MGQALPASPGAAAGKIYFTAEEAKEAHETGERVILVRLETSPEDIEGMHAAEGILTVRGGMTSHAAVVARGMGTACISGCGDIVIDEKKKAVYIRSAARPILRGIIFPWMAQPVKFTTAIFRHRRLRSAATSAEL